jgi:hypothetical protein
MANERPTLDTSALLAEIERYLATVDAFRAEGVEPTWADDEAPRVEPTARL